MTGEIRHPEIIVQLTNCDGNAFAILGAVRKALRRAGLPDADISMFTEQAMSGDYDHLLRTCMCWVSVR